MSLPDIASCWTCPDCNRTWLSAVKPPGPKSRWKCPCGHDTKETARIRNNALLRAKRAAKKQASA